MYIATHRNTIYNFNLFSSFLCPEKNYITENLFFKIAFTDRIELINLFELLFHLNKLILFQNSSNIISCFIIQGKIFFFTTLMPLFCSHFLCSFQFFVYFLSLPFPSCLLLFFVLIFSHLSNLVWEMKLRVI